MWYAKNKILSVLLCCCLVLIISPIFAYPIQSIESTSIPQNNDNCIGNNTSDLIKNNFNTITNKEYIDGEKEEKGKVVEGVAGVFSLSTGAFLWLYQNYGGDVFWWIYKLSFTGGVICIFIYYAILFHPTFI